MSENDKPKQAVLPGLPGGSQLVTLSPSMPAADAPNTITIDTSALAVHLQDVLLHLDQCSQQHLSDRMETPSDDPIVTRRRAVLSALFSLTTTYRRLHFPARLLDPIDHLISALCDLDHGVIDPLLRVRAGTENRGAPQTEWQARAFAAAACEALRATGMSRPAAAMAIAVELPEMDRTDTGRRSEKSAREWRAARITADAEAFNNPTSKNAGPSHDLAIHRELYAVFVKQVAVTREVGEPERRNALESLARSFTNHARRRFLRIPLTQ